MHETHSTAQPLNYASPLPGKQASVVYVGGGLGMAGAFVGLGIFMLACFGFEAAFKFSLLPFILGVAGLLLSFFGAMFTKDKVEDTHVVAALFVSFFAITGALLEMSVWLKWTIFHAAS
jgi:hypothetical protein